MLSAIVGGSIINGLAGKVLGRCGLGKGINSSELSAGGTGREYCTGSIVITKFADI